MSKSKILTEREFFNIRSGQTFFYVEQTKSDKGLERKVVALEYKGTKIIRDAWNGYRSEDNPSGYAGIFGGFELLFNVKINGQVSINLHLPQLYPGYYMFKTRRAAQRFCDSDVQQGALKRVKRVRKPIPMPVFIIETP